MLKRKTLFFLSPIPWKFHNRQIPIFAEKLSQDFNVVYFDCSSVSSNTISLLELFTPLNLNKFRKFLKDLWFSRKGILTFPVIITLGRYEKERELGWFDGILFKLQLKVILKKVSDRNDFFIWTSTLVFDKTWRRMKKAIWVFDYFDRYPKMNKEVTENEKWLLRKSKIIMVCSQLYKKLASVKRNKKTVVVTPVGISLKQYLGSFPRKSKGKITVGYLGGLSDRLDFRLIISAIKKNPDIDFVFVGPIFEISNHTDKKPFSTLVFMDKLKSLPNVKLVSFTNKLTEIEKLISGFTIGWIPYNKEILFNKYCTPVKFYEYCAFGIPTISTKLDVLKEYKDSIFFINNGSQLRSMIKKILRHESIRKRRKRKDFANQNDIEKKFIKVREVFNNLE